MIKADVGGQPTDVEFRWNPNLMIPTVYREMQEAIGSDSDGLAVAVHNVARLVQSWTLVDDNGDMLPITVEFIEANIPMTIIGAINSKIMSASAPNETTGSSSDDS